MGYKGEIWHYDGKEWHREGSPTNVTLTAVAHISPEAFVVCGLHGTVIVGGPGRWSLLNQTATRADFWGAAHFGGKSFVSNYDGVFVVEGTDLRKVYPGPDQKNMTAYLSTGSTSIWSVGQHHVARSDDGTHWTEVESP